MTRTEVINELARVVWLSKATTRESKVRVIEETADGRAWLNVDRWNWTRLVADVLRAEQTYEVL